MVDPVAQCYRFPSTQYRGSCGVITKSQVICCCHHQETNISLTFGNSLGYVMWLREGQARLGGWRSMAHRPPTIDACFSNITLAYVLMALETDSVVPTVIHFAPLLRARMLPLWRECPLRLRTFIF